MFVTREVPKAGSTPCPDPVTLPDRRLSEKEINTYWGGDRTALRACEEKRKAAAGGDLTAIVTRIGQ